MSFGKPAPYSKYDFERERYAIYGTGPVIRLLGTFTNDVGSPRIQFAITAAAIRDGFIKPTVT